MQGKASDRVLMSAGTEAWESRFPTSWRMASRPTNGCCSSMEPIKSSNPLITHMYLSAAIVQLLRHSTI